MRTLRLVSAHGGADLSLVDELTGRAVPDVLRLECAPLELTDRRWFATVVTHDRDGAGAFRYDENADPVTSREMAEIRVGTIWSV